MTAGRAIGGGPGLLVRFGVSVEQELLASFDRLVRNKGYTNRSEALRDLMREQLISQVWQAGAEVVGTITLVYDHHVRELEKQLTDLAHDHCQTIVSALHVHLNDRYCLEVMVLRGKAGQLQRLADLFRVLRGVRHGQLSMTGPGEQAGATDLKALPGLEA